MAFRFKNFILAGLRKRRPKYEKEKSEQRRVGAKGELRNLERGRVTWIAAYDWMK